MELTARWGRLAAPGAACHAACGAAILGLGVFVAAGLGSQGEALASAARDQGPAAAAHDPARVEQEPPADELRLLAQVGGETAAVAAWGRRLVIGLGPRLVGVDVSDPARPLEVCTGPFLPGLVRDVAVVDGVAVAAVGTAGLSVVDLTVDGCWTKVGQVSFLTDAGALAAGPGHVYVADGAAGMRIVDVRDPSTAIELGRVDTPGRAVDVAVAGNLVAVADGAGGLRVIDVSNPTAPAAVGAVATSGDARAVALDGTFAAVADGVAGLRLVDLSVPANPTIVGTFDTPGIAVDVAMRGGTAYVADGLGGLRVVDVSRPSDPVEVTSLELPGGLQALLLGDGDLLYVGDVDGGVRVLDVGRRDAPVLRGDLDLPGRVHGVSATATTAHTVGWGTGLTAWNLANRREPEPTWTLPIDGRANALDLASGLAYVAALEGGLWVADVDAVTPRLRGSFAPFGLVEDVVVDDAHAFAVDGETFYAVDVRDPDRLAEVGRVDRLQGAVGVRFLGGLAVVAGWERGVWTIDVSRPSAPRRLATLELEGGGAGVAIAPGVAYVAADEGGLQIVDVSTPNRPLLVGVLDTPGNAESVTVAGSRAFVADRQAGLHVIDVADPFAPVLIATFDTPGTASAVAVEGEMVLVADESGGLVVLQFGPPPPPGGTLYLPLAGRGAL